ncbi:MAG: fused response regulator/phosphatase [Phycisphaerae bacterium]|nr:fused response regulator/phosphatase [Phycisphaerae bacterium]
MDAPSPACAEELAAAPLTSATAGTILLAEDDPDSRALVAHFLRRAGYTILEADDGARVFDILRNATPALFLLDCEMPALGGIEVCQRLKRDPRFSDLPVIFLTALSDPESIARGFDAGGADYVKKPIEKIELLARIRNHLEMAQVRHSLQQQASRLESVAEAQHGRLGEVRSGQESLLTKATAFPELKLGIRFHPAHEAGGDFYEVARLTDDEFGLLVADVSGHDLAVPFITGALKALSATFLNESLTPQDTMLMLNGSLCRFLAEERYITACYARYSQALGQVELIGAGHPPPLHQSAGGELRYIDLTGDVLGIFDQIHCTSTSIDVRPGDRLYLYTDGLIEGYRDASGHGGHVLWGMSQLERHAARLATVPISTAVDSIVDGLLTECGGVATDDIVVLGIEF